MGALAGLAAEAAAKLREARDDNNAPLAANDAVDLAEDGDGGEAGGSGGSDAVEGEVREALASMIEMVAAKATAVAEGYKLHLSSGSPTGYLGVRQLGPSRYEARYAGKSLGTFYTAVVAAVAFAKAVKEEQHELSRRHRLIAGDHVGPVNAAAPMPAPPQQQPSLQVPATPAVRCDEAEADEGFGRFLASETSRAYNGGDAEVRVQPPPLNHPNPNHIANYLPYEQATTYTHVKAKKAEAKAAADAAAKAAAAKALEEMKRKQEEEAKAKAAADAAAKAAADAAAKEAADAAAKVAQERAMALRARSPMASSSPRRLATLHTRLRSLKLTHTPPAKGAGGQAAEVSGEQYERRLNRVGLSYSCGRCACRRRATSVRSEDPPIQPRLPATVEAFAVELRDEPPPFEEGVERGGGRQAD